MNFQRILVLACLVTNILAVGASPLFAQSATEAETQQIQTKLEQLQATVAKLKKGVDDTRQLRLIADVAVFAKAAEWILRHKEFYRPGFAADTLSALDTGLNRAKELSAGKPSWKDKTGRFIHGYFSKVDGSVQPYALTLPAGVDPLSPNRWPLHLVLHGRGSTLNEVNFIKRHEGKPVDKEQTWIQLDVFGRTNNAYRWAGETDVFEALNDVKRRYRIDDRRITLWGFSMGGAGSWHLGLHYPSLWSSVGPGAGFVDFYKYQKQTKKRPPYQHKALHIYDSVDYVLNAYNVPICTYGGELDAQLVASTSMVQSANELGAPMKLIVGPGVGHKFHPESKKEFMAFHLDHSKKGRAMFPGSGNLKFITYTLKYNECDWLIVEEMLEQYKPVIIDAKLDRNKGILNIKTENVAVLQIARDVAALVKIDGEIHPLRNAAMSLLPSVYYELGAKKWELMSYEESKDFPNNQERRKRKNLQGPIDDAFMQPFVAVRGTGKPWSQEQHDWAHWTLDRFDREFDKWMRGKIPIVDDTNVTDELIAKKNLILFGDPGSNSVMEKILDKLEIKWTKDTIVIEGKTYDPKSHGLSMIYPNPLNPRRYIVINSGHTMHEKDFKASNSWLFPRLGDIAIQKFTKNSKGGYDDEIVYAEFFNSGWHLPSWRPVGFKSANRE